MRLFSTPEGDAGFALKGDDIVSVFKHPKAPYRNVTKSMLDLAKSQGGRRLDAFDTVLPHLYAQSGFRAVARLPWNEEYKPEGWNHNDFINHNHGRPDVVFMAHDPQAGSYQPGDGRMIADYDEGTAHQHAALAHVAARGNVPAEPGPEAYGSGQLIRMANPLTVHHGTPHEFKGTRVNPLGEFDLSKLGTGEGAQAYGKGIYQADNPRVAEGYRDELSGGPTHQGKDMSHYRDMNNPHALAVHQVAEYMQDQGLTPQQAIEKVRDEYEDSAAQASYSPHHGLGRTASWEASQERARLHLATSHAAQRLKPEDFAHAQGQLYESELHIHPDHMLDWNKPIRDQHPYVQHHAQKLVPPTPDGIVQTPDGRWAMSAGGQPIAAHGSFSDASLAQYAFATRRMPRVHDMTGEQLHNHLFNAGVGLGKGKGHAAAQALLQAGIPGIRYLDAGSRGRGQGTHNYVVFDPRTLNVVKRNGLPAMVDAGADALREHKRGTP